MYHVSSVLFRITHGSTNAYLSTDQTFWPCQNSISKTQSNLQICVWTRMHLSVRIEFWPGQNSIGLKLTCPSQGEDICCKVLHAWAQTKETNSICLIFEVVVRKQLQFVAFAKFTTKQPLQFMWKQFVCWTHNIFYAFWVEKESGLVILKSSVHLYSLDTSSRTSSATIGGIAKRTRFDPVKTPPGTSTSTAGTGISTVKRRTVWPGQT